LVFFISPEAIAWSLSSWIKIRFNLTFFVNNFFFYGSPGTKFRARKWLFFFLLEREFFQNFQPKFVLKTSFFLQVLFFLWRENLVRVDRLKSCDITIANQFSFHEFFLVIGSFPSFFGFF
jgi:hypothetical protein